ncbi:HesB/YadR/YfhF family protein [Aciduricibacillus chroicocephali]|uniref:HesB/YadR/YfhF family protein n=1 Tax=Aciduricibacillus chroicocephali TaxID=3054939 RepID=A0ABY9KYY0_9BACI|nr:HesB/YadR/YfhF family protein [Bacillaceae bacterium 44XB]
MKLTVSDHAATWYKEELELNDGDHLRFYVRYGGCGLISGFSLGVKAAPPKNPLVHSLADNILFFIETDDAWYFEGKDLHISMESKMNEPVFHYN